MRDKAGRRRSIRRKHRLRMVVKIYVSGISGNKEVSKKKRKKKKKKKRTFSFDRTITLKLMNIIIFDKIMIHSKIYTRL